MNLMVQQAWTQEPQSWLLQSGGSQQVMSVIKSIAANSKARRKFDIFCFATNKHRSRTQNAQERMKTNVELLGFFM